MAPTLNQRKPVDVVIVGAGIAGLAAARALSEAGRSVILLEAQPRVGGRIHTLRRAGWTSPLELGAEFVHARPAAFMKVIREARIETSPQPQRHVMAQAGKITSVNRQFAAAEALLERLPDEERSFASEVRRPAVRDGSSATTRRMARDFVEGFNAAEASRISSRSLVRQSRAAEKEGGERIDRVLGGFDALVDTLTRALSRRRQCQIFLSMAARTVAWSRGEENGILVSAASTLGWRGGRAFRAPVSWRARTVLVTVPLPLLKGGHPNALRFIPALPAEHRRATADTAAGSVAKLLVRFREPFWKRKGILDAETRARLGRLSFLHTPRGAFPTWWTRRPLDEPVLVGWAAGPAAARVSERLGSTQSREARESGAFEAGLGSLARALGVRANALEALVDDFVFCDWQREPWARCAYSWLPVGAGSAPSTLATPIEGRLFFAGEACDVENAPGTVHGAYRSGLRAAQLIQDQLRR
jgi:monoamine oxidase